MFSSTTLSILFAIGFTVFFLGVVPLWTVISDNLPLVNNTEQLVTDLQNLQQKKDELVKIYNSVPQENINKLEAVIPGVSSSLDIPALYVFFETVSRENGFRLDSINVGSKDVGIKGSATAKPKITSTRSGLQEISVVIDGAGSYESIKSFMRAIESNLRLVEVVSFSLSPRGSEFSLSIAFKTYHQ